MQRSMCKWSIGAFLLEKKTALQLYIFMIVMIVIVIMVIMGIMGIMGIMVVMIDIFHAHEANWLACNSLFACIIAFMAMCMLCMALLMSCSCSCQCIAHVYVECAACSIVM